MKKLNATLCAVINVLALTAGCVHTASAAVNSDVKSVRKVALKFVTAPAISLQITPTFHGSTLLSQNGDADGHPIMASIVAKSTGGRIAIYASQYLAHPVYKYELNNTEFTRSGKYDFTYSLSQDGLVLSQVDGFPYTEEAWITDGDSYTGQVILQKVVPRHPDTDPQPDHLPADIYPITVTAGIWLD